jgi:HdeA/HdeB family protein
MPMDRFVSIRGASCQDLLKLSPDDRAAAAMFYIGYQSARVRAAAVNVPTIPDIEFAAESYCEDHPGRTAAQAFAVAYSSVR